MRRARAAALGVALAASIATAAPVDPPRARPEPVVANAGVQDVAALAERLAAREEGTARDRRQALIELGTIGTPEALRVAIPSLADLAMVADQAQIELGRASDEETVALLLGKEALDSRDDLVRLRAAELLGRVLVELDPEPLGKALRAKDAELVRTLLWTIERQAAAGRIAAKGREDLVDRVGKLRRKDKVPEVRAAALSAEVALGVPFEALAAEAAEDDAGAVRCALVLALGARGGEDVVAALAPFATDPERCVRSALADALAQAGSLDALRALVDLLEREGDLRLSWTIVQHLQDLSGRAHGRDARPWKDWVATLQQTPARPGQSQRDYGAQTVAFSGMPLLSESVALLIDFSGSMWRERPDGGTLKQIADAEIARTLQALPEHARFNLIPFTQTPHAWRDATVDASPRNVQKGIEFFTGCKHHGQGDYWGAMALAFEDPSIDTLIVYGDGAPSGGRHWNIDLMADLMAEKNRYRRATIDAVLVGAADHMPDRWRRLCERTGGRVLVVDP